MTPIDDELRAALQGRAASLAPAPDPLVGIERRARRIRRNRVGAAVAASALAVSAIAVAVPALVSERSPGPDIPRMATVPPSPTAPAASPYALDPEAPWGYRGADLELLGPGTLQTIETELGVKRGATSVELTPLFGQVYEPSGKFELFFLADVDGELRWGISETPNDGGPEFLLDEPLQEPVLALAGALPGDEVGRLYVVSAPGTTADYGPDGESEFTTLTPLADGVGVTPLDGDPVSDLYLVNAQGEEVYRSPAPSVTVTEQPSGDPEAALDPENPWPVRGNRSAVTDGQLEALGEDWATRNGIDAEVELRPLFVQRFEEDAGVEVVYLVRSGDGPWTWGVASLGEGGWWWYAENEITDPLSALVATLPGIGGKERLLVVGAPSMGGAVHAADGSDFEPMSDLAPGVFVTDVQPGAGGRWKLLDGNGDLDDPVAEGDVPPFQNAG